MKQSKERARSMPNPNAKTARKLKLDLTTARARLKRTGVCTEAEFNLMDAAGDFAEQPRTIMVNTRPDPEGWAAFQRRQQSERTN